MYTLLVCNLVMYILQIGLLLRVEVTKAGEVCVAIPDHF